VPGPAVRRQAVARVSSRPLLQLGTQLPSVTSKWGAGSWGIRRDRVRHGCIPPGETGLVHTDGYATLRRDDRVHPSDLRISNVRLGQLFEARGVAYGSGLVPRGESSIAARRQAHLCTGQRDGTRISRFCAFAVRPRHLTIRQSGPFWIATVSTREMPKPLTGGAPPAHASGEYCPSSSLPRSCSSRPAIVGRDGVVVGLATSTHRR